MSILMDSHRINVADVYVPAAKRKTLDADNVDMIAESMLERGQESPILVRQDGARYVLVEGLHRLEACRALGEATILAHFVRARRK